MAVSAVPPVARPALVLPPAAGFDWPRMLTHWLPDDPFRPDADHVQDYYATKAAIAAWLQPRTVLEIGVRAGYSALAFYLGHRFTWYAGYDSDRGEWGGKRGYSEVASRLLQSLDCSTQLLIHDTQRLAALVEPVGGLDLAHIDGDHSYNGAKHDIVLCLNAGARYVVVDDAAFVPAVRAAADDIIDRFGLDCRYVPDALGRGNFVVANRDVDFPPIPTP